MRIRKVFQVDEQIPYFKQLILISTEKRVTVMKMEGLLGGLDKR
jgi:hypothetical protein